MFIHIILPVVHHFVLQFRGDSRHLSHMLREFNGHKGAKGLEVYQTMEAFATDGAVLVDVGKYIT